MSVQAIFLILNIVKKKKKKRRSKNGYIYVSRRYKILYDSNCVVELCFKRLIKTRVRHDFNYEECGNV